ncbi:Syntaxin-1A [Echinococcus granulosus]|uniref:Syntaxin-1A n=2 Tax=Echinococcus granulosus TaxID=6210 RepID=W6V518_ECHGR|nr:Syntaxin-1A [Echinococcus granulosus]EUB61324.1 Syntaxin-1A [Echinococcus granulosus]
MTRDRLAELRVRYQVANGVASKGEPAENVEILDSFLDKVNSTAKLVDEISMTSSRLDEYMRNVKNLSLRVGKELKALEESAKTDHLLPSTGIDRIKAYQHSALLKKFQTVMKDYNRSQLEYRDKCKSRIKLQLQVAGADVNDEKVEDMLESTNPCVFTDAVLEQTTAAKKSLIEIEARHADIIKLEKSIEEMREMFAQIALLVDQQGDLIDNIEHNVGMAVDRVEAAKASVEKAVKTQKSARKKKIICYIILGVLILILITTVASLLGLT